MKSKKALVSPLILLAAGLLVVAISLIIDHAYKLPDSIKGIMMGFGIGIELVAVFKIMKLKQNKEANTV